MIINIPKNSLIILVGVAGSGKSTFAKKYFKHEAIVSSDACRRLLFHGDHKLTVDEAPLQQYSEGAFMIFYAWLRARLAHDFYAVADSTAIVGTVRQKLESIAHEYKIEFFYLVFNTPESVCIERDSKRPFPCKDKVIKRQHKLFSTNIDTFVKMDNAVILTPEDCEKEIEINWIEQPIDNISKFKINAKAIDIIGDIHGCHIELITLLEKLGYVKGSDDLYRHPEGRIFVSLGDIVDRGPGSHTAINFFKKHIEASLAISVMGNHDNKFARWLMGKNVTVKNGLQETINQIPADLDKKELAEFIFKNFKPYYLFEMPDTSLFALTHAAFKANYVGFNNKEIQSHCMYGQVVGREENGFPIRAHWENWYKGIPVAYGHTVTPDNKPLIVGNTHCLDTGCVFGGSLTCLRLPEKEYISVEANKVYFDKSNNDYE